MTLGTDREKWWRMEKRGGKDRKREGGKANERERKLLTPHTHATIRRLTGPARCTRGEERARHVTQARALLHDWHRHYHTILLPPTHTHPTHKRAHTHTHALNTRSRLRRVRTSPRPVAGKEVTLPPGVWEPFPQRVPCGEQRADGV